MVFIELDMRREIKFSAFALMKAEQELGVTILGKNVFEDLSYSKIIVLLWAGLLHMNRKLSIEQAANLFEASKDDKLAELITKLGEAMMVFHGLDPKELEKKIEEMTPTAKSGKGVKTGSNSKVSE